jgi:hypothetical protein
MKKLILFLTVIAFSYSCSSSDDSNSNNDNPSNGNVNYEFTITINGEVHKVQGNTNSIVQGSYNNECLAMISGIVKLTTNDVSVSNYISGQHIQCWLQFPNLMLGTNQAPCILLNSPYLDTLADNLGCGTSEWSSVAGTQGSNLLTFTITDLGTTATFTPLQNFGATLKGNYSGTIYLSDHFTVAGNRIYDIPVQLSIDFKAVRYGY